MRRRESKLMDLMAKVDIAVLRGRSNRQVFRRTLYLVRRFHLPLTMRGPVARPGQGLDVPALDPFEAELFCRSRGGPGYL